MVPKNTFRFVAVVVSLTFFLGCLVTTSKALSSSMPASTPQTSASSTRSLSLGADTLRTLVLDAARHDEDHTLDLQGILWLEHINLVVGSKLQAQRFYLDFLGLSKDLSPSFHCNLGQQQFHLAENGDPAQKITGSIGLVVPSLDTVRERIAEAQKALEGTQFAIVKDNDKSGGMMTLTCPWGNTMHLYSAEVDDKRQEQPVSDSPPKMVKLHAAGGSYAASRLAIRGNPGIRYVEIACPPGTTDAIARFYREMLGCTVSTPSSGEEQKVAAVCVGPGVHLVYVENNDLTEEDSQQMEGVHLCIYTAPGFESLYHKLKEANLIWTNPRFTHLDSCDTWQEAAASRTLRFKDIIDLDTGKKVLELEHETRPSRHGQFLKVPHYEPK